MSTIISYIQEEPKHMSIKSINPKMNKSKEVEIKAPSIPSNRERIMNKDDVVLNVKGFYNDLDSRLRQQNHVLKKILEKSQKIVTNNEKKDEE